LLGRGVHTHATAHVAHGAVVEVGFGSGLNLPCYDPAKVMRLIGVDPNAIMLSLAKGQSGSMPPWAGYCPRESALHNRPPALRHLADGFRTRSA